MTSLFKLIDSADEIVADGFEVDDTQITPNGRGLFSCGGDIGSHFKDQEVTLGELGNADAMSVEGHMVELSFTMVTKRPMSIEDVPS